MFALLLDVGPLKHSQICELLEPWYEDHASFGPSLSNILGQMRREGSLLMEKRLTGRRVYTAQYGYIDVTEAFWSINPYLIEVAKHYMREETQ